MGVGRLGPDLACPRIRRLEPGRGFAPSYRAASGHPWRKRRIRFHAPSRKTGGAGRRPGRHAAHAWLRPRAAPRARRRGAGRGAEVPDAAGRLRRLGLPLRAALNFSGVLPLGLGEIPINQGRPCPRAGTTSPP
ncbi:hypothetical protein G6F31_017170 [Rhizopus arrhizus]|nr:hypothetical protein G6F31_017170 [Rhizopus arrhizus]